ncbi:hypothetical protein D3C81_2179310 [compost metagenome]
MTTLFIQTIVHNSKFFAADSAKQIPVAEMALNGTREILQHYVPFIMAVGIIHPFKVIEIQQ